MSLLILLLVLFTLFYIIFRYLEGYYFTRGRFSYGVFDNCLKYTNSYGLLWHQVIDRTSCNKSIWFVITNYDEEYIDWFIDTHDTYDKLNSYNKQITEYSNIETKINNKNKLF